MFDEVDHVLPPSVLLKTPLDSVPTNTVPATVGSTAMPETLRSVSPLFAGAQVFPPSVLRKTPIALKPLNVDVTYKVVGVFASMARDFTSSGVVVPGATRPLFEETQEIPPLVVLKKFWKAPAYTTAGLVGSIASVWISGNDGSPLLTGVQLVPPLRVLKIPSELPA